ncbi:MAG: hypothetical protein DWQ07_03865 [Chloroflexi bacterium]|nr:MAG: hypothetical protein DWQ07_03865 [Chloroflexota bacterium]MBL1193360.1 hypothetical protein [Chloroflexota bacterium]NOH10652.1 hypothetical protein [Chloroflexota bacterium]
MKRVLIAGLLIALLSPIGAGVAAPPEAGIPVFAISSVVTDSTVTISGSNFLLNDTYNVLMGAYGTQAIGGTKVGTQSTGNSSSFTATYSIPAALKGDYRIAIRLESPTTGYYSFNWFYNNTSSGSSGGTGGPTSSSGTSSSTSSSSSSALLSISKVVKNTSFVLTASGLPTNEIVRVRLTKPGANNAVLEKVDTGNKGTIHQEFLIPDEIKKAETLVVSLESTTSSFVASTSFTNPISVPQTSTTSTSSSSSSSGGTGGPIVGIPTFNITAVKKDTTVTISGVNFIPGDIYDVLIGAYGTQAIGGIKVDTQAAGTGSFTATYTIPASLAGSSRLAIRLQSHTTGYFSYNWFYNNNHP